MGTTEDSKKNRLTTGELERRRDSARPIYITASEQDPGDDLTEIVVRGAGGH